MPSNSLFSELPFWHKMNRMSKCFQICIIALLVAALVAGALVGAPLVAQRWAIESAGGEMRVWFVDVGEADTTILRCGGEVMMIDGGNASDSSLIYSLLRNTLGIEHIDYMVATHPHEDHVGGLSGALNACTVGRLYTPTLDYDGQAFDAMLRYAREQGTEIVVPKPGERFRLGGARVTILGPLRDYAETNDDSIVLRVDHGAVGLLFGGDAEAMAERELVESGARLDADVLKVNHHGSDSSSCAEWLEAVSPSVAVISCARRNAYGHPDPDVLERLRKVGAEVLRTDQAGTILCVSDGWTVELSPSGLTE